MIEISELDRLIKEGKIAFFVGAGISKDPPSNLLLGDELKNNTIDVFCREISKNERKKIPESVGGLRPEVILQIIHEEIGDRALDILDILKSDNPNQNHFFLAKAIDYGNTIITTNFDNLIEYACIREGFEPSVYFNDEGFERWFEEKGDNNKNGGIFKIHGTLEEIHVTSVGIAIKNRKDTIIATLNQVGRGLSQEKSNVLEHFLKKKDMVFIGYSGLDDFDIYPKMFQTESEKKIFWLEHVENAYCKVISLYEIRKRKNDHIDKLLANRSSSFRIVCDTRKIIKDLWKEADFGNFPSCKKNIMDHADYFVEFAKNISIYNKTSIISHIFDYSDEWDEAIKWYIVCQELCSETNEVDKQAKLIEVFFRLGLIYRYKEEYEKALDYYNQTLELIDLQYNPKNWNMGKAEILHQIGRVYQCNKNYPSAISYIKKAISLRQEINDVEGIAYSFFQLLMIYLEMDETNIDFEGIERSAENAIAVMKKYGDYRGVATMYHNIAFIQQAKAYIQQKNKKHDEAIKTYLKAIDLYKDVLDKRNSLGVTRELGMTNARLGECYMGLVEIYHVLSHTLKAEDAFHSAKLYSLKAKNIFEEIGDGTRLKQVSKTIEQIQNVKHLRGKKFELEWHPEL